jgi:uncharacterized protein
VSAEKGTLRSSDGLALEMEIDTPDDPRAVVVLCHPHPQMGGTMNAPLLQALRDDLVLRRWAVLRFNFRGIGRSEGESTTGEAEVADAEGGIDHALGRFPGLPVALAGWSFGAAVAVRAAARRPELLGVVGIAPAVRPKPEVTAGLPDPRDLELDVPLLFVCAANDELVETDDVRAWADAVGGAPVEEVRGANHFFWAKYDRLTALVGGWLDSLL